ncbi:hypothetical protein [Desulfatibacillum aliphaticivorans]|uniref:hypothetical protein n=1 Tax=Desulfatibacillum aliphaticivorans TaxID=218208 RepID=UPI0005C1B736|nr:hypothetical protein [Desulfatibacillum aliphaticivorans]
MGGWIGTLIGGLSVVSFYGTGHKVLFWISVTATILIFWSWGIMHNFAMKSAKFRWDLARKIMIHEERPIQEIEEMDRTPIPITSADLDAVPDMLAIFNFFANVVGAGLLVCGIILRLI